jgi:hypothetical protein
MTTRKKKLATRAKSAKRNPKKTVSKATQKASKRTVRTEAKKRVRSGPKERSKAPEPSVAIYEVIETEVYENPSVLVDDQDQEFGT